MKYPGKLGEMRVKGPASILTDPDHLVLAEFVDHLEGLKLLLEHYQITEQSGAKWLMLSLALARDHVPFFSTQLPAGRPSRSLHEKMLLVGRVLKLTRSGMSESAACRELKKQYPSEYPQKDLLRCFKEGQDDLIKGGSAEGRTVQAIAHAGGLSLEDLIIGYTEK